MDTDNILPNPDIETEEQNEEQELFENHRIVVDKGQEMMRMDKYLMMRIEGVSRTKIQAATKANCVLVNDKPSKANYKVKPLDTISILLPTPPREIEIVPEGVPLNIFYEDDDVLIINKQAGLVVHPGFGNFYGTMLNGLAYYYQKKKGADGEPITPYLVHRIDKDTSGLIIVAKNETAHVSLAKQFYDHTIERKYNALVWGDFKEDEGTIVGNIGRSVNDRRVMTVYSDPEQGKHAVTHWRVLERFGYVTLIECVLETGRTHQIRAHMKHIGHPLFNDAMYGGDQILKGTTFSKYKQFVNNCFQLLPRQALHALVLGFEHPTTHEHMHFEAPLPEDMTSVLEKWRKYAVSAQ